MINNINTVRQATFSLNLEYLKRAKACVNRKMEHMPSFLYSFASTGDLSHHRNRLWKQQVDGHAVKQHVSL